MIPGPKHFLHVFCNLYFPKLECARQCIVKHHVTFFRFSAMKATFTFWLGVHDSLGTVGQPYRALANMPAEEEGIEDPTNYPGFTFTRYSRASYIILCLIYQVGSPYSCLHTLLPEKCVISTIGSKRAH